eukprot:6469218-Amphidinium_carterae.1
MAGMAQVSLGHRAHNVPVQEPEFVSVTLFMHAKEVEQSKFQSFQRREALGQYLGPLRDFVQIKTSFLRGDVFSYLVMIPLANAKSILQISGQSGMAVGSTPEVDKQLDLTAVFCNASSLASVLSLLESVEHYGVVGPLRRGGYLVRASPTSIALVRRRVCPADHRWKHHMDMV